MTVSTTTNKITFAGQTSQDTFAYNFRVDEKSDMEVYFEDVLQPDGDWTITNLGNPAGGDVILNTPLVQNTTVVLLRNVPKTQSVDYQPFDAFPAETHEGALDRLTFITQQLQEQLDRSAQLKVDTALGSLLMEEPVANKILIYNASADEIVNGGDAPAGTTSGIDDNTTKKIMDLADTIMLLGSLATEYNIAKPSTDSLLDISGGTPDDGGSISLFGSTHGLSPGDVNFRSSANTWLLWDESTGILTILTGAGSKTLAVTFNADQSIDFASNISSLGFDDTASGKRMRLSDTALILGVAAGNANILNVVDNQSLILSGGSASNTGANIVFDGGASASTGDMLFRNDTNTWMLFDESTGIWTLRTGIGSKTLALTIDASQVVDFVNPPTTDGIAFPATQVASADANTLDDYEEETVQVAFTSGTGTITIDTSFDTIKYTKIGNLVHIQGTVKISSVSSPTGLLTMTGLPFTSIFGPELSDQVAVTCFAEALGTILDGILVGRINGLQSSIVFFDSDSTVLTNMADHIAANTFITISASYVA